MKRSYIIIVFILCTAAGGLYIALRPHAATSHNSSGASKTKTLPKQTPPKEQQSARDSFDKAKYSTTDPTSIWVIANKTHPLTPRSYAPQDLKLPNVSQRIPGATEMQLRAPAATAVEVLFKAAAQAGYELTISTAYRGYAYQKTLYDNYAASDGIAQADTYSARPGYSEHQTGLALDIRAKSNECPLKQCFGELPEGKWLAQNAYKYGFILRYTKDKEAVTGYHYEPWHFRYVGTELAAEMHRQGITTLEEFFGVSGGTTYR